MSHRPTPLANGGFGRGNNRESVEDRVNALAAALGVPPKELASAIAGVVKSYVPPASLSSATIETGTPAESLSSEKSESVEGNKPRPGVLKAVINGVEILVGMDEPPSMEDPLE